MTTFAPRRQMPIAAGQGAPFTGAIPTTATTPIVLPERVPAAPARGSLARLLSGLRRRPAELGRAIAPAPVDSAYDAVYRDDEGGWGDDGGWD